MTSILKASALVLLLCATQVTRAQNALTKDALVGTWTLAAIERSEGSDEQARFRGGRGVLILDRAGNVFEFFNAGNRDRASTPQSDALQTLTNVGGFWGTYELNAADGRIDFRSAAGVSPNVRGIGFSREFEWSDDRLVLISGNEPHAQNNTRWTWQRMPTVEHLTPAYREVMGFWQHVEERQVNQATGEVQRSSQRAPSLIVYSPSGFVGVHFPAQGRDALAAGTPTAEDAAAALRGYIGYFGTLGVFPGEVSHNILSGVSPGTGSILRRYANIRGDELIVTLQSGRARGPADASRTVTEVVLRRLSNADDMLPH